MNVQPTVEVIIKASETMHGFAAELSSVAIKMSENKDISYVGEALNIISNCFKNLHIDLLATRPIREFQISQLQTTQTQEDQ